MHRTRSAVGNDGSLQEQLKESVSQLAAVQRNYESLSRIMQQRQQELEAVRFLSPCWAV